MEECRNSSTHS